MVIAVPVGNHNRLDRLRADAMDKFNDTSPSTRRAARIYQHQSVRLLNYSDVADHLDMKTRALTQ